MTPDDIAAIRRGYLSYSGYPTPDIAELCDALQAAWIRADDLAQSLEGETRRVDRERERAERAEAEELLARNAVADALQHIDEMYAEMRHACQNLLGCPAPMYRERAERAEAAFAEEIEAKRELREQGCQMEQQVRTLRLQLDMSNDALARVRALCDEASEDCPAWDQYNVAALVADIRAAIEWKR